MKIESTHQQPAPLREPGCDSCQTGKSGISEAAKSVATSADNSRAVTAPQRQDRVTLSGGAKAERSEAIYRMSELRKKADEQLAKIAGGVDEIESIDDSFGDLDRTERVEIAKLRASAGFYSREDVIDEIARRIADNVG